MEKEKARIIPQWLIHERTETKIKTKTKYNPKSLKQIARDEIEIDDKQLNKKLAKKMINPFYFTKKAWEKRFNIYLYGHHINHVNSKLTSQTNYSETGIETRYGNQIVTEMAKSYARLKIH